MSESFDPYHAWLGIPPKQQPPTHYRLLAVEPFEGDPSVIESAADQRMAHLRTFQTGKRGALTQRLLNEVAAAKVCLLDPNKKAAYDDALRQQQAAEETDAVAADVFASVFESSPKPSPTSAKSPGRSKPGPALMASGAAVALVLIAACIFLSNIFLSTKTPSDGPPSVAKTDTPPKPADANVGQAASLPVTASAPASAVRGSPEERTGPTEGLPRAPETSGQPVGVVGRPAPSADAPSSPPAASPPATSPAAAPQPAASDPDPKPTEEPKKHPIPSAETQREIGATIEETYKTSEAKTPEAKVQLAKELSAAAGKSARPEEQYVLLRKAIDLACDGGDAALMLETIGPMTDTFAIDPLAAKAAMLERFAKGPRSPARVQSLAEGSRAVIDEAIAEDRYEIASSLAKTISDASSRASPQLRKEAADRGKRVGQAQKQFEEVQKALETLKASPEDAEANLTAGSWYCFVKDDWKTGLAHLAKGSDPVLKSLAGRELSSPPATPEDQLKLADAWWDAAAERRGEQQAAMLRTAGHWYEQAIGQLQGINKTKAEKRLSQIAELTQDTLSRPGREPPPAIAPFDAKRARAYQLQWARYLKVPVEFTNSIGMRFLLIPPGGFDMGSSPEEINELLKEAKVHNAPWYEFDRLPGEGPRHRVRITRPFYLGVYEVTQSQYQQVMGTNPSRFKNLGPSCPVESVFWNDSQEFCRRLSESANQKAGGLAHRLPTEAEWEYACRAGTDTRFYFGNQEADLGEYVWWAANSRNTTHPVGQKRPNAFGLYDMCGSVFEFCADWHDVKYYSTSPADDPTGPPSGSERVLRGGSYLDPSPRGLRSAYRAALAPTDRGHYGFRVAVVFPAKTSGAKP